MAAGNRSLSDVLQDIIGNVQEIGSNLHELEHKVRSVTDWKQHFQSNPMTMLGVALCGGILLATMLNGRK